VFHITAILSHVESLGVRITLSTFILHLNFLNHYAYVFVNYAAHLSRNFILFIQRLLDEIIDNLRYSKFRDHRHSIDILVKPGFMLHCQTDWSCRCSLLDRVRRIRHSLRELDFIKLLFKGYRCSIIH
jgi:hypothetical protein